MAWQLIYTSAPRLLEAGRSGFGTVARHRQINPLLAAAVERFSQFSRLPGLDPARVIFAYRTVTAGSGRFHVLSFVRDSGADYTGRTNHLAHHLILDPSEVAKLGRNGPSPADVLLAMPWRQQWDEPPRWLDAGDEIAVAKILPQTTAAGTAWAQITGEANHVWLLAQGEASRSACLLTPPGLDLRPLFAESLRATPERAWQTTFTTSFQPSDDAADFRWLGVEAGSDLAATIASGRRPLDLTAPHSLPPVELAAPAGAQSAVAPSAATLPSYSFASSTTEPASAGTESARFARRKEAVEDAPGDPFADSKPMRRIGKTPFVLGVALTLLLGTLGIWLTILHFDLKEQKQQVINNYQSTVYLSPETKAKVVGEIRAIDFLHARRALKFAKEIGNSGDELEKALEAGILDDIKRSLEEFKSVRGGVRGNEFTVPDELRNLASFAEQVVNLSANVDKAAGADGFKEVLFLSSCAKTANDLGADTASGGHITPKLGELVVKTKTKIAAKANDRLTHAMINLLMGDDEPRPESSKDSIAWFEENIPPTGDEFSEIRTLLTTWKGVRSDRQSVIDDVVSAKVSAPSWLRDRATNKKAATKAKLPQVKTSAPQGDSPPANVGTAAILYFAKGNENLPELTIKELPSTPLFTIDPPINGKVDLVPFGGVIANGLGAAGEFFKIDGGHIKPGKTAPPPPYRLTVLQSGTPVAIVFVSAPNGETLLGRSLASQKPPSTALSMRGESLTIDATQLGLPGKISQPLWLNLPPNFNDSGTGSTSIPFTGWSADLRRHLPSQMDHAIARRKELQEEIETARKGVESAASAKPERFDQKGFLKRLDGTRFHKDFDKEVLASAGDSDARFFFALLKELSNAWSNVKHGEFVKGDEIFSVAKDLEKPTNPAEAFKRAAQQLTLLAGKAGPNEQKSAAEPLRVVAGELSKLSKRVADPAKEQEDQRHRTAETLANAQAALDSFKRNSIVDGNLPPGSYLLQVEVAGGDKLPLLELLHKGDAPQ
jgi:hypothetical protein